MFEAWSVAVRIRLIDGFTHGLIGLSKHLGKANADAAGLQRRLDSIGRTMAVGTGMMTVGGGMLWALSKTLPAAKEYANQLSLLNTLGMKQADIAKVVAQAWQTSWNVPTTTISENLKSFRELRSVFGVGHESEAASMLPIVGRIQGVLTALTGHEQDKVGFDLVKAIELRTGVMTQAALQRNAELMSRTIIGMGGTVTVSDFHGALKMGKIATNKWSDDFTYNYLPTLMQELKTGNGGAQTAGTALMSLYQQMHGRMTKAAMPLWVAAGLVKPSDIVKTSTGQYQMKPGSVAGTGLFEQNPFEWVQNVLKPGVARLMASKHITAETALNAMFSNRNAAFAAYNMYMKSQQYERDKKTIGQADSYDSYQKLLKTNPALAQMALQAKLQDVSAQVGYTLMPSLLGLAKTLIPQLVSLSQWIQKNPDAIGKWVKGFAAIGILLSGAGFLVDLFALGRGLHLIWDALKLGRLAVMVFGVGLEAVAVGLEVAAAVITAPITLIVGGLAAIGVAFYEIWKHWDSTKSVWQNLKTEIGGFLNWLWGIAKTIAGLVPGFHGPGGQQPSVSRTPAGGFSSGPTLDRSKPGIVVMDGAKVGQIVTNHQARAAGRAQGGYSSFDPTMAMPVAGLAYHGGN